MSAATLPKVEKTLVQQVEILIDRLNAREKPILVEIAALEGRLRELTKQSEEIGSQKDILAQTLEKLTADRPAAEPKTLGANV